MQMVYYNYSYCQITYTEIEKKIEPEAVKGPPQYDSLSAPINAIHYIGLKLFFPTFNDKQITNQFLSTTPQIIEDTSVENTPEENTFVDDSSSYPHYCKKFLTFRYKPFLFHKVSSEGRSKILSTFDFFPKEYQGEDSRFKYRDDDDNDIGIYSKCNDLGNRYFTVVNVISRNALIASEKSVIDTLSLLSDKGDICKPEFELNEYDESPSVYVLKDDMSGDTIYRVGRGKPEDFILVPYFVKLKEMFDNKFFTFVKSIPNRFDDVLWYDAILTDAITNKKFSLQYGSKWKCNVTLLDQNKINNELGYLEKPHQQNYQIACMFKNDTQTIAFFPHLNNSNNIKVLPFFGFEYYQDHWKNSFVLSDVFAEQTKQNKLQKDNLLAKQKRDESIAKAKYQQNCIDKFGEINGKTIAEGKVRIGMTAAMCETAWGKPWNKNKSITSNLVIEEWSYAWGKKLYFKNDILIEIDE